jgi:hypothetical protein
VLFERSKRVRCANSAREQLGEHRAIVIAGRANIQMEPTRRAGREEPDGKVNMEHRARTFPFERTALVVAGPTLATAGVESDRKRQRLPCSTA